MFPDIEDSLWNVPFPFLCNKIPVNWKEKENKEWKWTLATETTGLNKASLETTKEERNNWKL